jgi:hypothetical protein
MECPECTIWGLIVFLAVLIGLFGPQAYYRLRYGDTKTPLKEEDE